MTFPDNEFERLLAGAKAGLVSGDQLLNSMPGQIVYASVVPGPSPSEAPSFVTTEIDDAPFVPAYSSEVQLVDAAGEVP